MDVLGIFVLGVIVGWLIEWIIDWFYWRKKHAACLEENAQLKAQLNKNGKAQGISASKDETMVSKPAAGSTGDATQVSKKPDDLTKIKGIGPVISGLLNDVGITTFAELARKTPEQLQDLLGDQIERLADEESLIAQARKFAGLD